MRYQQLKIDIKTSDGITKDMYDEIVRVITAQHGEVLDDGSAPYTEDMSDYYGGSSN